MNSHFTNSNARGDGGGFGGGGKKGGLKHSQTSNSKGGDSSNVESGSGRSRYEQNHNSSELHVRPRGAELINYILL